MSMFFTLIFILMPALSGAVEIISDSIERYEKERKIVASGNVMIKEQNYELKADRVIYYEQRGEIEAFGDVYYRDDEITAWAEEGFFNTDRKTGLVKRALIHIRKQDIWIKAEEIERVNEVSYRAKRATFSTCKPEQGVSQPWCITSESVELTVDESFFAKVNTFRVKDFPIMFSPFFWGPGGNTKKSGFLPPRFGNSNRRGIRFSPSYYYVIDSSKDLTFYLDYFSKVGVGKGVEFRYMDFDLKGMWYAYHIYDDEVNRHYLEFRGSHIERLKDFNILLDINFVNRVDFYREYADLRTFTPSHVFKELGKDLTARYDRFLQSSAQVSLPFTNSRAYVLGQGWKELKREEQTPPVKVEAGYVVYPFKVGPFDLNLDLNLGQYYKNDGLRGTRFEVSPKISHNWGDQIRFSQSLKFSQLLYSLSNTLPEQDSSHREVLRYDGKLFTRLIKRETGFFHIVEPFFEGIFVTVSEKPPVLSEEELIDNTALLKVGFFSRLSLPQLNIQAKVTQSYDFRAKDRWEKLYPLLIEGRVDYGKFSFSFDSYQNLKHGKMETFNSALSFSPNETTSLSFTQRFTRNDAMIPQSLYAPTWRDQYTQGETFGGIKYFGVSLIKELTKRWSFNANINYSAKGEGLRDSSLNIRYAHDCWAGNLQLKRRPVEVAGRQTAEYSFLLFFELKGIGTLRVYERGSTS